MPPIPPTLQRLMINVTFQPQNIGNPDATSLFTFSGDINESTREITVWPGIAMIIFNLDTSDLIVPPPGGAVFQTEPIQWLKATGEPNLTPHMFMLQRIGDNTVTLLDFNSNQSPDDKNHVFNLVVSYNGKTYGSDPTIINEPPDSGG